MYVEKHIHTYSRQTKGARPAAGGGRQYIRRKEMTSYPNQKKIIIEEKNAPQKGDNNYFSIKKEVCEQAIANLNRSSIALFFYLYANKEGYEIYLSPKEFCDKYGISQTQYYEAVKKLIEKKYLVEKSTNIYEFHSIPKKSISLVIPNEKREFLDSTGSPILLTYIELKELVNNENVALQMWKEAQVKQSTKEKLQAQEKQIEQNIKLKQAQQKQKEEIKQVETRFKQTLVELPPSKDGKCCRKLYDLDNIEKFLNEN